jgi:SOS-response transcriptional repressor LexA
MKVTINDYSMFPFLKPDDVIEVEPGRPITDGRVCLVKYGRKEKVRQVFKEGEYYRLQPLNPNWSQDVKYVHVEKVETYVIAEESREWLKKRWRRVNVS